MKFPSFRRNRNTVPVVEPDTPPALTPEQQAFLEKLAETRRVMGEELAQEILPDYVAVRGLTQRIFQSKLFREAGYSYMPEVYGQGDNSITTVDLDAGAQVFVVARKVWSGNPWEVGHAAGGGVDNRQTSSVVYTFNGADTITEYSGDQRNTYDGESGRPDALLIYAGRSLGRLVATETFTP